LGLVSHPKPFGAFNPSECLTNLLGEVRADNLLFKDGLRIPNFITDLRKNKNFATKRLTVCVTRAGEGGGTPSDVENDKA